MLPRLLPAFGTWTCMQLLASRSRWAHAGLSTVWLIWLEALCLKWCFLEVRCMSSYVAAIFLGRDESLLLWEIAMVQRQITKADWSVRTPCFTWQSIPLAGLMLECLACGHQGAAEAAIEYFDMLNSVPMSQRHPQLGAPLYATMLPHLSRLASYPRSFSSWDQSTEEPDMFYSFRWDFQWALAQRSADLTSMNKVSYQRLAGYDRSWSAFWQL